MIVFWRLPVAFYLEIREMQTQLLVFSSNYQKKTLKFISFVVTKLISKLNTLQMLEFGIGVCI